MENKEKLRLLDESIEKWKNVVYKKIYSSNCPLCEGLKACEKCPISIITNIHQCQNTSFYETTINRSNSFLPGTFIFYPIADNQMLCELYEIRRKFVQYMIKKRKLGNK